MVQIALNLGNVIINEADGESNTREEMLENIEFAVGVDVVRAKTMYTVEVKIGRNSGLDALFGTSGESLAGQEVDVLGGE
jgi:hypothetical protein